MSSSLKDDLRAKVGMSINNLEVIYNIDWEEPAPVLPNPVNTEDSTTKSKQHAKNKKAGGRGRRGKH